MTRIRRLAVLGSTATALLLAGALPADASFSTTETKAVASVTTVDVTAPTSLSTAGTKCDSTVNWDGSTTTTLHAKLSWKPSTTTRGVTGYRVVALVNGYPYPIADVPASATSLTGDYDASVTTNTIRVTVTTLTSYGWSETSDQSGQIKC
jgi:hypothetical protein